jgi:hypothetical protein
MYLPDFLKAKEGQTWTAEDTAEVNRIVAEIERLAVKVTDRRIAELKADRERLCQTILDNPCRKALANVLGAWSNVRLQPCADWNSQYTIVIDDARKALLSTEGQ